MLRSNVYLHYNIRHVNFKVVFVLSVLLNRLECKPLSSINSAPSEMAPNGDSLKSDGLDSPGTVFKIPRPLSDKMFTLINGTFDAIDVLKIYVASFESNEDYCTITYNRNESKLHIYSGKDYNESSHYDLELKGEEHSDIPFSLKLNAGGNLRNHYLDVYFEGNGKGEAVLEPCNLTSLGNLDHIKISGATHIHTLSFTFGS